MSIRATIGIAATLGGVRPVEGVGAPKERTFSTFLHRRANLGANLGHS